MGGISVAELEEKIKSRLEAEYVKVVDVSDGCGQAFEVVIVSYLFQGKATLQRHRLVNEKLKEEIAAVHAFSQKTYTPEQWKEQASNAPQ